MDQGRGRRQHPAGLARVPAKSNRGSGRRGVLPSPQPKPGLPGLVTLYLPEAGKPAARRGGVGGGGRSQGPDALSAGKNYKPSARKREAKACRSRMSTAALRSYRAR